MTIPQVRYGEGVLADSATELRPYTLVTDPVPLRLYGDEVQRTPPDRVLTPTSLERRELEGLVSSVPAGHTVIGLGGGTVLDAAKYLAYAVGQPLLLAPTIASTNTAFTPFASVRDNGATIGTKLQDLRWQVLVDLALLRRADPRFHRAGFGDLLALTTALRDAVMAADQHRGPSIDDRLISRATATVERALGVAGEVASTSDDGLRTLVALLADWSELTADCLALGAGTEHLFAWNLERVTGRDRIHGEAVALGVVVATFLQDGRVDVVCDALDRAEVRWRPSDLDLGRRELQTTLATLADYNRDTRRIPSIVDTAPWEPGQLPRLWDVLT